MKPRSFPLGMVVTLVILWLGLVGATAWGWWTLRSDSPPLRAPVPLSSASGHPSDGGTEPAPTAGAPGRLVWTNDALWRFSLKAGGAALGAILFLLMAVGAGMLVQEKAESVNE